MPEYICGLCGASFDKKSSYNNHLIRKKPCKVKKVNDEDYDESLDCEFCNKTYSTKYNLNKHLQICKVKLSNSIIKKKKPTKKELIRAYEEKETLVNLKKEISELKTVLKESIVQNNNNQTTNNQITNNNNNITVMTQINQNIICNFGKEDLNGLGYKYFMNLLTIPRQSVQKLVEDIHFNPNRPQNMNIILPDRNNSLIYVYENKDWVLANKDHVLYNLVDKNFERVDDFYEDHKDHLERRIIENYERYTDDYIYTKLKEDLQNDVSIILEKESQQLIESTDTTLISKLPNIIKSEEVINVKDNTIQEV